jgi:polar amino acid transport system substrate-binding protein
MAPSSDARPEMPAWRERVVFAYLEEPPFCFRSADGRASGCDVELAQAVLRDVGVATCDFVEAEFAELIPGLIDGRWSMTTGLFVTPERRQRIAFSRPIWALHDGLLVRTGNPRDIAGYGSIAADANTTLAIVKDQRQRDSAIELGVPAARIVEFNTQKEAADAVAGGMADAYASVAMAHRGYLASHASAPLTVVDVPLSEQPPAFGAFGFASASAELAEAVNRALRLHLGTEAHRELMTRCGFAEDEVDRVVHHDRTGLR